MDPKPSPLFTGRDAELTRIEAALARVKLAFIDGVAGVGKTTLALAVAERWPGEVVVCQAGSAPLGALLDDARLALGPPKPPEPQDDASRISDLIERLEEKSALFVLDDAHILEREVCTLLVNELSSRLERARAVFTSRQRWTGSARAPDHMELHLEGLALEAARRLWSSLDELYGPAEGFDVALDRWRGNPLFLRRAHAGALSEDDPLKSQVEALASEVRRLGVALALASQALPVALLAAIAGERGQEHVRALIVSLVVEVDSAGNARLHDLFRDALLSSASAAEIRDVRSELARALIDTPLDTRFQLREVTRQLEALEHYAELDAFLLTQVKSAVRSGATGALLYAMERVPEAHRSVALRIERARCIGRHYDQRLAFAELERLLSEADDPAAELTFAFAEAAYDRCQVDRVIATLGPLLTREGVPPELRLNALARYTAALTVMGRGNEGRKVLEEEETRATDPAVRARLALHIAMLHNADEEYDKAAGTLARARISIDKDAIEENAIYVPLTFAVIYARAGRFEESDALLVGIDLDAHFEDESAQEFVTASRASLAFERGDRMSALSDRLVAQRKNEALGNVHYEFTNAIWQSRLLFALGRKREADALIAAALLRARELGCFGIVLRLERSRELDPVRQLGLQLPRPPAERRGELARWLALHALVATESGRPNGEAAVMEAESHAAEPGYGLERAVLFFCRARLARGRGASEEARALGEAAEAEAERENVDPDLLGLLEAAAEESQKHARSDETVVLDGSEHELRSGTVSISLRTRPVLRRLLYSLATDPGTLVSKETLVESTWSTPYDPLRHDTALWQNIHRLRRILEPAGLGIEVDELGYRLIAPKGFQFIQPSHTGK